MVESNPVISVRRSSLQGNFEARIVPISCRPFQASFVVCANLQKGFLQGLYAGLSPAVRVKERPRVSYCLQEKLLPGLRLAWHSP